MSLLGDIGKAIIGQAAGSLLGSALGGLNAQTSNHYSRELMRYQTELQHNENQFWADYNSPVQQMQRLQAAGLNPNLVYGNGSIAQVGGSVSPNASSDYRPANIDAVGKAAQVAQIQNLEQQNQNLRKDYEIKEQDRIAKQLENIKNMASNPEEFGKVQLQIERQRLENLRYERDRTEADMLLKDSQRFGQEIENAIQNAYGEPIRLQSLIKSKLENAILYIQSENLPLQIQADLSVKYSQATQLAAQAAELAALKSYYETVTDNEERKRVGIVFDNAKKYFEAKISKYAASTKNGFTHTFDTYINPIVDALGTLSGGAKNVVPLFTK